MRIQSALAVLLLAGTAASAQAAVTSVLSPVVTSFHSQAGSTITAIAGASTNAAAVEVTPNGLWVGQGVAFGNAAARWISTNPNTGDNPAFVPPNDGSTPYMVVEETFTLTAGQSGFLSFETFADDTARLVLNGVELFAGNFSQNICADGVIGCQAGEGLKLSDIPLALGLNTLTFEVFQVGGSSFGLQYAGEAAITPLPAALPLLAAAAGGLGVIARRRRTAA